ncbi:MAG: replication initiator protein A [Clostridia bacterium]|nr:replication initiator protein A [Clostridia bacterium]
MNNNLYKINEVTQHKYYQVPKELYINPRYKTVINNDAKMLYALLLDRMELSRTNGWVEDDGTIFLIFKREDLADMLGICVTTVWRAIKQLKEVGLIEEKRQGLNRPNLIYIGKIDYSVPNEEVTETDKIVVDDNTSESFISSDIENLKVRTFTAEKSGVLNNKSQDISNLKPNDTDNINNPDFIDTDDIETESIYKAKEKNIIANNSS